MQRLSLLTWIAWQRSLHLKLHLLGSCKKCRLTRQLIWDHGSLSVTPLTWAQSSPSLFHPSHRQSTGVLWSLQSQRGGSWCRSKEAGEQCGARSELPTVVDNLGGGGGAGWIPGKKAGQLSEWSCNNFLSPWPRVRIERLVRPPCVLRVAQRSLLTTCQIEPLLNTWKPGTIPTSFLLISPTSNCRSGSKPYPENRGGKWTPWRRAQPERQTSRADRKWLLV